MIGVQRDSDRYPVLVELEYFDVINPTVPPDWCFFDLGGGYYRLEPCGFGGDFWQDFHDGDRAAEASFAETISKLNAYHEI
ncbi:hypothetical protein C7U60_20195 [Mesorhizobium plurifarium]|nr:hypothetical protein C7U60_20195 [Mesorhizobium plurifarium]